MRCRWSFDPRLISACAAQFAETVLRATEMEIALRYRYAASIGSLVWALTKKASDRERTFDWGQVTGHTWPGVI